MTTRPRNLTDLEVSPFQKRPAYRYIRASDHLPTIEALPDDGKEMALVKLFDPTSQWTWYVAAYTPETREAFGLVTGDADEYGYFSMPELVAIRGLYKLPIERDLHWKPRPLKECHGS